MNRQHLLSVRWLLHRVGLTTAAGLVPWRYSTSGRPLFQRVTVTLFVLVAPVAAYATSRADSLGSGRLLPTVAMLLGLTGILIGRQALIRSRRAENVQARTFGALGLGLVSLCIGVLHASNSAGGFGTGNGLAGALVAIGLGVSSMVLGILALARSRRMATGSNRAAADKT